MAKLTEKPRIELEVTFTVTEAEARALDALVGYGDDAFIAAFKTSLGAHYIRDHEDGLRLFFTSIRQMMPSILGRVDEARDVFQSRNLPKRTRMVQVDGEQPRIGNGD